ncbi:efflux RND transporter periplasmic adaptor subunit [candidate division KSB1 bacterium]|nr:efflux RND transporter periplasmic adaptor subunit [candidate division KSB1 bacterium]
MKKWMLIPAVFLLILIIWIFTKPGGAKIDQSLYQPQTELIKKGNIKVEVSATGIIEPINKVEIKSKASGLIEEMTIEEADIVKKGDLIARLDQRDTKNTYDQSVADRDAAEANVEFSESDFERKKELLERGLISVAEYDAAKLALVDAKARLVQAKINVDNNDIRLKDTIVRSPINGVILTKDVEIGQIISSGISSVSGGTLIATIAEMDEVYVKADVDEVDIGRIKPGMDAIVIADAYPNQVFKGKVIRIAAQAKVEQNVTSFEVTIQVQNLSSILKAGMNTAVEILVADKKDVVLVSNEALMTENEMQQEMIKLNMLGNQNKKENTGEKKNRTANRSGNRTKEEQTDYSDTYRRGVIIKDGDKYRIQLIKAGVSNFDYTEVLDGLNEGDQIVYTYFSRALQSSEQFRERMIQRSTMQSGLRNSQGSN